MFELVYNSMAVPAKLGGEPGLERILSGARKTNSSIGITGLLLYHCGEFVQILEGDRDAVMHVYNNIIVADPRHCSINLCWDATVAQRGFADWSMGFYRADRVLIARGRDAADVAISTTFGPNTLKSFRVWTDEAGGNPAMAASA